MKKALLLPVMICLAFAALGQRSKVQLDAVQVHDAQNTWKITDVLRDSIIMTHVVVNDTVPYYLSVDLVPGSNDSGYFAGTGYYEFTRFAERYDFTAADSSVQVIGVLAALKGRAGMPSTHNAVFKVWSQGDVVELRPTFRYSGFPSAQLASVTVPYSNLGFGQLRPYYFSAPTSYLYGSFFVGFSTDYTWATMNGDTMSVYLTGQRLNPLYHIEDDDTTVNDQTVIGDALGWADFGADIFTTPVNRNYWMFPIVNSKVAVAGVNGITSKDFTFLGNSPNPCINNTNIRFSLAAAADVSITTMDVNGRVLSSEVHTAQMAGEHTMDLDTRHLAAGEYLCLIRTNSGGGVATKFVVVK